MLLFALAVFAQMLGMTVAAEAFVRAVALATPTPVPLFLFFHSYQDFVQTRKSDAREIVLGCQTRSYPTRALDANHNV